MGYGLEFSANGMGAGPDISWAEVNEAPSLSKEPDPAEILFLPFSPACSSAEMKPTPARLPRILKARCSFETVLCPTVKRKYGTHRKIFEESDRMYKIINGDGNYIWKSTRRLSIGRKPSRRCRSPTLFCQSKGHRVKAVRLMKH